MTARPRFTVIIPTRERADVLVFALRTVLAQDYDSLEVIVSDNASADGTRDAIAAISDPRVRYVNTGQRVSMAENWEFALGHATGDWIALMGDDDGLMPGSLNSVAEIARETGVRAIRSRVCKYSWPSMTKKPFGRMVVPLGDGYEVRETRLWQERVLNGVSGYASLPILYNGGFVGGDVIAAMRKARGKVYFSSSPDVYSAMAICSLVDRFTFVNEPLAISGASSHSTGASYFSGGTDRAGTPATLFQKEDRIPLHPDIPRESNGTLPKSIPALVYEAYLQSQFLRGEPGPSRHAEQLEVALALATKNAARVFTWGRTFAAQHALDFEAISARAAWTRRRLAVRGLPGRLRDLFQSFELGSPELPLRDVVEATAAAADLRRAIPPLAVRVTKAVDRGVRRRMAR